MYEKSGNESNAGTDYYQTSGGAKNSNLLRCEPFRRRDNEWFYREMPDITRDKIRIFNGKSDLVEYDVFRVWEFDICCRSPVYIQSIGNDGFDDCLYQ